MKRMWQLRLLLLTLACQVTLAQASPTSDDYVPCHRLASVTLLECLTNHPHGQERDQCWGKARDTHDTCYADVVKSYRRDDARIKAEKQAREKYRQ